MIFFKSLVRFSHRLELLLKALDPKAQDLENLIVQAAFASHRMVSSSSLISETIAFRFFKIYREKEAEKSGKTNESFFSAFPWNGGMTEKPKFNVRGWIWAIKYSTCSNTSKLRREVISLKRLEGFSLPHHIDFVIF